MVQQHQYHGLGMHKNIKVQLDIKPQWLLIKASDAFDGRMSRVSIYHLHAIGVSPWRGAHLFPMQKKKRKKVKTNFACILLQTLKKFDNHFQSPWAAAHCFGVFGCTALRGEVEHCSIWWNCGVFARCLRGLSWKQAIWKLPPLCEMLNKQRHG